MSSVRTVGSAITFSKVVQLRSDGRQQIVTDVVRAARGVRLHRRFCRRPRNAADGNHVVLLERWRGGRSAKPRRPCAPTLTRSPDTDVGVCQHVTGDTPLSTHGLHVEAVKRFRIASGAVITCQLTNKFAVAIGALFDCRRTEGVRLLQQGCESGARSRGPTLTPSRLTKAPTETQPSASDARSRGPSLEVVTVDRCRAILRAGRRREPRSGRGQPRGLTLEAGRWRLLRGLYDGE